MENFLTSVQLALVCYGVFFASVCCAQVDTETNAAQGCSDELSQLTSRLDEAITEISKLKKLSLTTLSMVLGTDDQGTCLNDGVGPVTGNTCRVLGTANYPALSCYQLQEACQVPSGVYYVRGDRETFHKVHCEMDAFGGGWTRFGKGNMSSLWNYNDEDEATTTIDVITASDIIKIQNMHFSEFRILTDVQFRLQGDDSINPSSLSVTWLPSLTPGEMKIAGSADHTHLLFDSLGEHIECFPGGGSHRCGHGGTPSVGTKSPQLLIRSAFFGPRAQGASITHPNINYAGQWFRNKYTWNGSFYYVLAK